MHCTDDPYENLANAIVLQAVADYRNALKGVGYNHIPAEQVIVELEQFFHSIWYQMLTKVRGEYLIEQLNKEYQAKLKKEQL